MTNGTDDAARTDSDSSASRTSAAAQRWAQTEDRLRERFDVPITRAGDGVTAILAEPGVYTVEGGGAARRIAVNVGDPDVSNVSRSTVAASSTTLAGGGRPWWLYALVAAFVLACVEWWTWHRRVTV